VPVDAQLIAFDKYDLFERKSQSRDSRIWALDQCTSVSLSKKIKEYRAGRTAFILSYM